MARGDLEIEEFEIVKLRLNQIKKKDPRLFVFNLIEGFSSIPYKHILYLVRATIKYSVSGGREALFLALLWRLNAPSSLLNS